MTNVTEIQQAILTLPEADYIQLSELDWDKWDRQIESDSADGNLEFLIADVAEVKRLGTL